MSHNSHKNILVIAAHPDDEVLGCGGTIAVHRQQKHNVRIALMADGVTSRTYSPAGKSSRKDEVMKNKKLITKRQLEAVEAGRILGVDKKEIYFLNFADQRLDTYPLLDLIKTIEKIKKEFQPDLVYTHYWNDLNLDHRLTAQAVLTAFRPRPGKNNTIVKHFEIPESTYLAVPRGQDDFVPNCFVDITSTLDLKLKALNAYESEKRDYPDLRSERYIKELAARRGKTSTHLYAEAFIELKRLQGVHDEH